MFGVYPLLPNRLVYPEIYPNECLYSTESQLVKKLKYICTRAGYFRQLRQKNQTKFALSIKQDEKQVHSKHVNKNNDIISELIDKPDYFDKYKWSLLKEQFILEFI